MTLIKKLQQLSCLALGVLILAIPSVFAEHSKHQNDPKTAAAASTLDCEKVDVRCAKTVTSAFSPNGDLWRLWSQELALYYQISTDKGVSFSKTQKIDIPNEEISARNENRPKIAFDSKQGVYLSWAMPREKKYTADIRFSYSSDYGKSFSVPITVNDDGLLAGHSFNEMSVNAQDEVNIVWLDGRLKGKKKQQNKDNNGSAIFMATANLNNKKANFINEGFVNKEVVNGTCVCCRLAIDYNKKGNLVVLWRHIYGDNIREFAITTLNEQAEPYQVSDDHWKINGCPHQGGALSIDDNNRYHIVWFNQGDKGKGIFYANSDNAGKKLTIPLSVGDFTAQASHPHMLEHNGIVDIVWLQFTGKEHQLWHQQSRNNGKTFTDAHVIATADNGADRPFIIHNKGQSYVSWQRFQREHWVSQL